MNQPMPLLGDSIDSTLFLLEAFVNAAITDMVSNHQVYAGPLSEDDKNALLEQLRAATSGTEDEEGDLEHLADFIETRKDIADSYARAIDNLNELKLFITLCEDDEIKKLLREIIEAEEQWATQVCSVSNSFQTVEQYRRDKMRAGSTAKLFRAFLDALEI